jgi:hypothetical protein
MADVTAKRLKQNNGSKEIDPGRETRMETRVQ